MIQGIGLMNVSTIVNPTLDCIRIRVPQEHYHQPIVSRLISRYNLTINIAAAAFEAETREDGWFNLEIQGSCQQLEAGFAYLQELGVEIERLNLKTIPQECVKNLQILLNSPKKVNNLNLVQEETTHAKFQICIPKNYRSLPVIAGLVSYYGITVNIVRAIFNTSNENDGWFNLELRGNREQIVYGLRYLKQLGLQIWL
ncbi:MAG: NIL domain-containing protein [Fischerella sp.]|nr:NIL domain-containing protein [Fischerella sp.]